MSKSNHEQQRYGAKKLVREWVYDIYVIKEKVACNKKNKNQRMYLESYDKSIRW